MDNRTRRPDHLAEGRNFPTLIVDGVCRIGRGLKTHRATSDVNPDTGRRYVNSIHTAYGCPTNDKLAYKANGFSKTGRVTCESCGGPYDLVSEV